eukprot:CAMPEP_0168619058 /NCGR_PEP_ID=MMETSP0449_2-20121227/6402_1 /TAXON_ID=1082188 /ORGANISM="Strombidium rassoulzadegani, Strain ras09" /LENGTH=101 /DNA_ID=CAMNT_0008659973 /DNA_START=763 /DNA_END=1068 /DNA_ORIENTATION=+
MNFNLIKALKDSGAITNYEYTLYVGTFPDWGHVFLGYNPFPIEEYQFVAQENIGWELELVYTNIEGLRADFVKFEPASEYSYLPVGDIVKFGKFLTQGSGN